MDVPIGIKADAKQMFRFLKSFKPVVLGRWSTNKPTSAMLRSIDLANCDSCGTCGVPEKLVIKIKEKYLFIEVVAISVK